LTKISRKVILMPPIQLKKGKEIMQIKALVAAVALTGISSLTMASDGTPGLQFAIESGTGNFVQFQSGPIIEGSKTRIYYDTLRVSQPANPGCPNFDPAAKITGYAMSDNSGKPTPFSLGPTGDYVKLGEFVTPECHNGSTELQIWFTRTFDGKKCYDSKFGQNYSFPVICKK